MRPLRLALPLAFTVFTLSACSFQFGETSISGEDLSEAAADAIESQLGTRPEVDCGDEDISPSEGEEVDCVMTDPATEQELDVVVTFTGVDGDQWDIEVEVIPAEAAAEPTEEPTEEATEDSGVVPPRDGEIPADDIATAAEDALEAEIGQRPEIDCGEVNYAPENGRIVYCTLTDPSTGEEYSTTVTFTGVEGDNWYVEVEVASEPN